MLERAAVVALSICICMVQLKKIDKVQQNVLYGAMDEFVPSFEMVLWDKATT